MKIQNIISTVLLASIGLAACQATQVSSITKDPAYDAREMRRVLVVAIVRKPKTQKMLEDQFVRRLQQRKSEGVPSYTLVPEGTEMSLEAWKKIIVENQFDSVIVSSLINMDVTEKDVDAKYLVGPGSGYGYYSQNYRVVYQPGFTLRKEVAAVETRVFDVKTEKQVWTGRSKTDIEQGRDPEAQIRDFVTLMMRKIYG